MIGSQEPGGSKELNFMMARCVFWKGYKVISIDKKTRIPLRDADVRFSATLLER